jgi:hypothetical protein
MKHLGQSGGHRPLFAVKSLSLQADREQWTVAGAGIELGLLHKLPSWDGGRVQILLISESLESLGPAGHCVDHLPCPAGIQARKAGAVPQSISSSCVEQA